MFPNQKAELEEVEFSVEISDRLVMKRESALIGTCWAPTIYWKLEINTITAF